MGLSHSRYSLKKISCRMNGCYSKGGIEGPVGETGKGTIHTGKEKVKSWEGMHLVAILGVWHMRF